MNDNWQQWDVLEPDQLISMFVLTQQFSIMLLMFAANNYCTSKDGARNRPLPSLPLESLHTNLIIPEVQRWRWVGGWRRRKAQEGMEDESGVEMRLAEHLFPSIPFTPPLLPKKHSFLSSSSRSPPNPSLLHCICSLIRSVWEAHEAAPPPPTHLHPCLSLAGTL